MKSQNNSIRNALIGLTIAVLVVIATSFSGGYTNSDLEGKLRSNTRSRSIGIAQQNQISKNLARNTRPEKTMREARSIGVNTKNNDSKTIVDTRGIKTLGTHNPRLGGENAEHLVNNKNTEEVNSEIGTPHNPNDINNPLPDLIVENVQFHPENKVKAKVTNIGNAEIVLDSVVPNMHISRPGIQPDNDWTTYSNNEFPLNPGQSQYIEIYNWHDVENGVLNQNPNLEVCIDIGSPAYTNRVIESNENNNCLTVNGLNLPTISAQEYYGNNQAPDLIVENIQFHPDNKVKAKVTNIGNAEIVLERVVPNMHISRPGIQPDNDWTTYSNNEFPLNPGQSQYIEIYNWHDVENGVLNQNPNLEVCIDIGSPAYTNRVIESNENNNCLTVNGLNLPTISAQEYYGNSQAPDLTIEEIQINSNNITVTVTNIGNAEIILESAVPNMYISRPGINGDNDWKMYSNNDLPLSPGQSQDIEIYDSADLNSNLLLQNPNLEACIDVGAPAYTNRVIESNENNNCLQISTSSVQQTAPALQQTLPNLHTR